MAEEMGLLGEGQFGIAADEACPPADLFDQAREHPQQGRFAGAIGAGHDQRLPGIKPESNSREDFAPSANAVQTVDHKLHSSKLPLQSQIMKTNSMLLWLNGMRATL